MIGTVRSFDTETRDAVYADIRRIAEHTASAHGASATVSFAQHTLVTRNDLALTRQLRPSLEAVVGADKVKDMPLSTIAEDFAYLAEAVPGFYYFVGATPADQDPRRAPSNHSPRFYLDEASLEIGLRSMLQVTHDFLAHGRDAEN
jgi:amidohydrolase